MFPSWRMRGNNYALIYEPGEMEAAKSQAPIVLDTMDALSKHLDNMHRRWVARNLFGAEVGRNEDLKSYLDANASMSDGEPILMTVLKRITDTYKQKRHTHVLIFEGAELNEQDDDGKTPLMITCCTGLESAGKALLKSMRVDLFIRDKEGNSALHYAAKYGRAKIVREFIKVIKVLEDAKRRPENGSSYKFEDVIDLRNKKQQTALDVALANAQRTCGKMIEKELYKRKLKFKRDIAMVEHDAPPFMDLLAMGSALDGCDSELLSDATDSEEEEDDLIPNARCRAATVSDPERKAKTERNRSLSTRRKETTNIKAALTPQLRGRLATVASNGLKIRSHAKNRFIWKRSNSRKSNPVRTYGVTKSADEGVSSF